MGKFSKCMPAVLLAACLLLASACASAPAVSESAGDGVSSAAGENSAAGESKAEESEPEEEEISIDGVWKVVRAEVDGKELSDEELEEQGAQNTTITLYPDGALTLKNDNVDREGTWSESNGMMEFEADGYAATGEFDGKTLSIVDETGGTENSTLFFERTGDAPAKSDEGTDGGDGSRAADAADIAGTWEATAVELDGERFSGEEMQDALGGGMRLEIDADGTFDAVLLEGDDEVDTSAGEWTQDGDVFTFVVDGDPETFTLSGNTLVAEADGITVIFEKK